MEYSYQLIFLGNKNPLKTEIENSITDVLEKIGISKDYLRIIDVGKFSSEYLQKSYSFCVYFGNENDRNKDENFLNKLKLHNVPILPIVDGLDSFVTKVPDCIKEINGIDSKDGIEKIVSVILEGLSLYRKSRKVFISYKRSDTQKFAIELYDALNRNGFMPFLDSYSIRPTLNFQEELFEFMTDCDIVILLNSRNFFGSKWTREEFERANQMGVGILEILFDGYEIVKEETLCHVLEMPNNLTSCIVKSDEFIKTIIAKVESMRAESLMFRRNKLISKIKKIANLKNINLNNYADGSVSYTNSVGVTKAIIPILGIPNSDDFDTHRKIMSSEMYFAYDAQNVTKGKQDYFEWLNKQSFPIKTRRIAEVDTWLN